MRTFAVAALAVGLCSAGQISAGYAQETEVRLSGTALIDHHLKAKWEEAGLKAARRADDAEFLRRVNLDIVGAIPSLEEAEKFLADKGPYKRQKLVEALLKDPGYAVHWADVWTGILVGGDNDNREQMLRMKATEELRGLLSKNMPYDEFARLVIAVKGAVYERPQTMKAVGKDGNPEETGLAGYVYNISREAGKDFPMALAGKLSRAFLGVQIQCAQCHDHPFDKWTQEEFYGMASFFTEVSARRTPVAGMDAMEMKKDTKKPDEPKPDPKAEALKRLQQAEYYYLVEDRMRGGALRRPGGGGGGDLSIADSKGGPIKAAFIETKKGAVAGEPRRATFAKYMTEPENLQFAKMAVNRMWAHFFGAGIVNPVDDFNGRNKATHPELLEQLARDFIAHKYDNHWLIKAISASEAYGLSSRSTAKERDPQAEKFFALARVRALAPEQILRSVLEATDFGQGMGPMARRMGKGPGAPGKGPGDMSMQERMMFGMLSQFRSNFGDDEGNEVVEFAGTIPAALLMMNSMVTSMGAAGGRFPALGGLSGLLAKKTTADDRVEAIFLSVLSRKPSAGELARWKSHVSKAAGTAGYEDLFWTLLNTSEFIFNH